MLKYSPSKCSSSSMSYLKRAHLAKHPLARRLFSLMDEKKSNLALAADVTSSNELLDLAESLGPDLCILKTHIDILEDFTPQLTIRLKEIADRHKFLLFEDRKFADIGNTVLHQYQGGLYRINDWAHITNAHALPGPGVIEGLKKAGLSNGNALLLLAQMSSKGNLIDSSYTSACLKMAESHSDFVIGFISQERISQDPALIHMTPGVQIASSSDHLSQQYRTPFQAIFENESDIAIVGRGILKEDDRKKAANLYRESSWDAYEQRMASD